MKEKQPGKYGAGWILLDCLLLVDLLIDVCSGRITGIQIIRLVVFSAIVAFFLAALFRRKRRRKASRITNPVEDKRIS